MFHRYQIQLLQAFNMHVFDEKSIVKNIDIIYSTYRSNEAFINVIKKGPYYDPKDHSLSLLMLFNYDMFDLLHKCIIDLSNNEFDVNCVNYKNIMKKLEN